MVATTTSAGHSNWTSRLTFILATIGFSVGLGNIWRFPYLAGESGGGAFVLIYIACVLLIGIPIVMAELLIGRRGGLTPIGSMRNIAIEEGSSKLWSIAGGIAVLTAFLIITYYCVIGGWTLHYVYLSASGALSSIDGQASQDLFGALLASAPTLIFWQIAFLIIVGAIVMRGLQGGIERAVIVLMPALFFILIGLAIFGLVAGDAKQGLSFLFEPDFSKVTPRTFLDAIGQAFFSVGVGMAAMMTYGAFLPRSVDIPQTSAIIAFADTGVALVAGLAIFPFVFALGLSPSDGPGLVFVTIPTALAGIGGGAIAAILFFVLLAVAAVTSAIALFEVLVAWGEEHRIARWKTVSGSIVACGLVGLLTVFSFNSAAEFVPLGFLPGYENATMFEAIDRMTSTIGLPLGGFLVAVFAGWVMSKDIVANELDLNPAGKSFAIWRFLIRWFIPALIATMIFFGVQE